MNAEQQARELAERCASVLHPTNLHYLNESEWIVKRKASTEIILRELNLVSLLEDRSMLDSLRANFRIATLEQRISALNWKISGHVDAGGGINELEKWVDALMKDSAAKSKMLLAAGLLPNDPDQERRDNDSKTL